MVRSGFFLWIEADFLEQPILPIRVPKRPLARVGACKDRHLCPAVIVDPLNPPIAWVQAIREDYRWLCGAFAFLGHPASAP
jgi:hypothetical protein